MPNVLVSSAVERLGGSLGPAPVTKIRCNKPPCAGHPLVVFVQDGVSAGLPCVCP